MKTLFMTSMAVALAAPVAAYAQMAPTTPAQYVKMAGAGDLYERTSSQIVLGSTKSAKVRKFATEMIADHTKSTAMVKAAAMKAGMKPMPPKLDPAQADMVAKLRAASGTARDQLYMQQQATAHQQALSLHQNYASNGTSAPLKMAASKIVPVIQHHIEMLRSDGM